MIPLFRKSRSARPSFVSLTDFLAQEAVNGGVLEVGPLRLVEMLRLRLLTARDPVPSELMHLFQNPTLLQVNTDCLVDCVSGGDAYPAFCQCPCSHWGLD